MQWYERLKSTVGFPADFGQIVTMGLGGLKVMRNRRVARRYEEPLPSERGIIAPNDTIPFGIRAIESGIEVEGIWISRPNTPAASARDSTEKTVLLPSKSPGDSEPNLLKIHDPGCGQGQLNRYPYEHEYDAIGRDLPDLEPAGNSLQGEIPP